jgi:hypothetical protein
VALYYRVKYTTVNKLVASTKKEKLFLEKRRNKEIEEMENEEAIELAVNEMNVAE